MDKTDSQKAHPTSENKFPRSAILISIIVLAAIMIGVKGIATVTKPNNVTKQINRPTSSISRVSRIMLDNFFHFSLPKPLSKLTILDLPDDQNVSDATIINGHLWFVGDGSIVEYDSQNNKIVSYTDRKKANCHGNLLYINGYIFTQCYIDNIDDAFGTTRVENTTLFTGHSGVLKINPQTHRVEHVFTKADGLLNGYNYQLYPDGNYIWIGTFNGVGRINTLTNHVDFYTTELGFGITSNAKSYDVNPIIVDKDYVWAWGIASVESQGGITQFTKSTGKWKAFGPRELKDYTFDRIDLEYSKGYAAKLIPGGIQIGFRDGSIGDSDRFVEKQYSYTTGKWIKISEQPITGIYNQQADNYIEAHYPPYPAPVSSTDQFGLTQINLSGSSTPYLIDGRKGYLFSPVIDTKRYLLTNATIDEFDEASPFGTILMKLGRSFQSGISVDAGDYSDVAQFLVDPKTLQAIIVYTGCSEVGYCDKPEIILLDLNNKKIENKYAIDALASPLQSLKLESDGNLLKVNGKDGKNNFSIDTTTLAITTPIPTPTTTITPTK